MAVSEVEKNREIGLALTGSGPTISSHKKLKKVPCEKVAQKKSVQLQNSSKQVRLTPKGRRSGS